MKLVAEQVAGEVLPRHEFKAGGGKTTVLSMASSVGAVVAACSCCLLPMLLAGLGLSTGVSSALSPIGPLRWPMAALSAVMLGFSWKTVIGQRRRGSECRELPIRQWLRTPKVIMLIVASLLTLLAVSWGLFEPTIMRAVL